ncbi:MAG: hypothetical protein WAN66_19940 [Limnoraphis robusta]|uniref:PEP-CTERM protein-sorting domain-containing protein n=1 Tax=Limnoraphis robusta CS-951 TaxID=1637645 RepID=A0A0F5Y7S7_9CYAN|nr:hypothetical protein [Limnoraphis robusta]KKD34803.1 hypothetical protein WN50_28850 [Limnoraphis robusta CS-951]KMW70363.1 hypothetical protein WN50_35905 [Limnoraphis robusta CS-951]
MLKKFQQRLNLVLGSISVFATLTLTASPSLAYTFARSAIQGYLDWFSHDPLSTETLTDAEIFTFATNGSVDASAATNAIFNIEIPPTSARNFSVAEASGFGQEYIGIANSQAAVIGLNFFIEAGSTFSFDFGSRFQLETASDSPVGKTAIAEGNMFVFLFEDSTEQMIDFFTISGRIETAGNDDFFEINSSDNFTSSTAFTSDADYGHNLKLMGGLYFGEFSRYFSEDTSLTLVEIQTNYAMVKAPEPSSFVAFFIFGVTGVALKKRKQS